MRQPPEEFDKHTMPLARRRTFRDAVWTSASLVAFMFWVEVADLILQHQMGLTLDLFGITPRTVHGLIGIVFSPLLHGSPGHLLANALPLLILLTLLFWDRHYRPARALWFIWLGSGLGTWLIGRGDSVHIGASSLIFGLVAYLIAAGFRFRSWRSVIVAFLVFIAFGGILYGVLPQDGPISWEAHLSGAVAGFIAVGWTDDRKSLRS